LTSYIIFCPLSEQLQLDGPTSRASRRCADETAMMTLVWPTPQSPILCASATFFTSHLAAACVQMSCNVECLGLSAGLQDSHSMFENIMPMHENVQHVLIAQSRTCMTFSAIGA